MRGRGLKYIMNALSTGGFQVAPHAGAWIEIVLSFKGQQLTLVAPHAGAWIEICLLAHRMAI